MRIKNGRLKKPVNILTVTLLSLIMIVQLVIPAFAEDATSERFELPSDPSESATESVTETEPVTEPVTDPVTEPVTEPTTEPTTEPVTEPASKTVIAFNVNGSGKDKYLEGERFDATGFQGTVTYSDGTTATVAASDMSFSPSGELTASDKTITFSCALTNRTCGIPVTVVRAKELAISGTYKNTYRELEENLDLSGIELSVVYADGTVVPVALTDCSIQPLIGEPVSSDISAAVIGFRVSEATTLTASAPLTVKKATAVEVRSYPEISFYEGKALACEPEDLGVFALFEGETEYIRVYNYDIPKAGDPLIPSADGTASLKLTIGSAETDFKIEVCKIKADGFTVTTDKKQDIFLGSSFDADSVVISAKYEDGAEFEITDFVEFDAPELFSAGDAIKATFAGHEIDLSPAVTVHTATIKLVKAPAKTEYNAGETFESSGFLAIVEYDNGDNISLTDADCTIKITSPLTESDSVAVFSYKGLELEVEIKVYPSRRIQKIEIAEAPTTLRYISGQSLTIDGIKVLVYYVGETEPEVVDPSLLTTVPELGSPVTSGMKNYTVRYSQSSSVYYDAVQPIEVETKTAVAITVITPPDRIEYTEGSSFNPAGMVVDLIYNDGSMIPIIGYAIDVEDPFLLTSNEAVQNRTLRITYAGFECSLTVKVKAKAVKSISILTPPAKTSYNVGDVFDPSGMKIVLNYSDSSVSPIILPESYYTFAPTGKLTSSDSSIYVSFRGLTAKVEITVGGGSTPITTTAPTDNTTAVSPEVTTSPSESGSTGTESTTAPGVITTSPDEKTDPVTPGTASTEPVSPGTSSSSGETTKRPSGGGSKGGVDTIMILWIGIIAIIVIALILVIIYYRRHFT